MRVLLSGGCKNGKSTLAQAIAVGQGESPVYIATMKPRDAEDEQRVARHRAEREGLHFTTVECPSHIASLTDSFPPEASLLLDSVTALLAEEMFCLTPTPDADAPARVGQELLLLADAYANIVFVSDYIYSDALTYDDWTQGYRKGLADIDRLLAARCDVVIEMVFGQAIIHKGGAAHVQQLDEMAQGLLDGAGALHGAAGVRPVG